MKIEDKVIYIGGLDALFNTKCQFDIGSMVIIKNIYCLPTKTYYKIISIDNLKFGWIYSSCVMSISEYRKIKLNKINSYE